MSDNSWAIEWHDVLPGTNDHLKRAAAAGAADRTVVATRRQTAGRGRGNNAWSSPPGGVYCSLLLREPPAALAPVLALAAGEAVARTLRALDVTLPIWLKWPNDVLVAPPGEKAPVGKAGGILVESRARGDRLEYAVVGIGLNLHTRAEDLPVVPRLPAVSLASFVEKVPTAEDVVEMLVIQMEAVLARFATDAAGLVAAVQRRLAWGGERVVATMTDGRSLHGVLLGMTASGALRLDTDDGVVALDAWDVTGVGRTDGAS